MKRIYKNPEIKVVKINPMKMIAASTLGFGNTYNGTDEIQSRQNDSFWDDEDE